MSTRAETVFNTVMSINEIDPSAMQDWSRPSERFKGEIICLGRTIVPDSETFERTIATIVLMLVWAAIVLGPMFTGADPPRYEIVIGTTAIVFTVVGKMWDFETKRMLEGLLPGAIPNDRDRSRDREEE